MNDGIGKIFIFLFFYINLSPNWNNSIGLQFNKKRKWIQFPMDLNSIYNDFRRTWILIMIHINQFN
jgi:hypothetical protein